MSITSLNVQLEQDKTHWYAGHLLALGAISGAVVAYAGWTGAAVLVVCALLVRWPVQVALGSFALLLPFDSVSAIGGEPTGAALTRFVGAFAGLVLLFVGLISKRLSLPRRPALWWSLFILWGVATLGWAANSQFAFDRLPTALSLWLLYVIATAFRINEEEMRVVLVLAVLGGCVAAVMSVHEFYSGTFYLQSTRSSLMLGNRDTDPNQFGASLLLPLSLTIGAVVQGRGRTLRACAMLAIATLSLALLLSMSRGALVAGLTVIVVYTWRLGFNRRIALAIVLLAALLLLMPQAFFARLGLSDRGAGRVDIWTASMDLVPRYGLFGAGWNNFIVAYSGIAGHAASFRGFTRGSHSIYVGMLIEVGAVGLMFLLLAFRSQLREGKTRELLPYAAACWAMVVMGITLDVVWRKSFWFAWIILAMAARLHESKKPAVAA
ncbi:MAG TPA: O-antigen ligase family protein [Terriglobales bacterium]|nr:O-antigen ligase family protein [Terriglobales bacterium]